MRCEKCDGRTFLVRTQDMTYPWTGGWIFPGDQVIDCPNCHKTETATQVTFKPTQPEDRYQNLEFILRDIVCVLQEIKDVLKWKLSR